MRRWLLALGLVILSCIPIYTMRASSPALLQDSDTAVLLSAIRERQAPLSWFVGDWPLQNHFYRPFSTLSFELDNRLFGDNAAGYGQTQALLCIACVLALFWFVRELTDKAWMATASGMLFALWHFASVAWLQTLVVAMGVLCLFTVLLPKRKPLLSVVGFLVSWTVAALVSPMADIPARVVGWLPGRTASIMALFGLIALAAYVRFERTSALRVAAPEPSPLDPPATRSTTLKSDPSRRAWLWLIVSAISLWFALGSYEQAIMLPACLLIVAVALRLRRYRVRWAWQSIAWGMLVAYLALRQIMLPSDVSGYQAQQFRSGPGVWLSIGEYILPSAMSLYSGLRAVGKDVLDTGGFVGVLMVLPYAALLGLLSNIATMWEARKDWLIPATALLLAFFSFLPMAWLKHFDHYHYWPMAFRALLAVSLMEFALSSLVSAASLPAKRAPERPDPAPGSLPRP
ncbi:MAG: hypothetical protein KF784_12065 [Fimbriimonadaceae bacterium]|nr:hypothetical protein [Fimbriimonadaceae bacterium]